MDKINRDGALAKSSIEKMLVGNRVFVVTAAGGNGTAIKVLDTPLSRTEYAEQGKTLGHSMEGFGAEQTAFLVLSENHLEMGGGEFCGNASRSAAVLFFEIQKKSEVSFTVSGYEGIVRANIQKLTEHSYNVECIFDNLPIRSNGVTLSDGQHASVVDLGGIVHVIIEAQFPEGNPTAYQAAHRSIMAELGLGDRGAVGVIWFEHKDESIIMHPVVWVKDVDTFFYEQSCGSGTIALSKKTGVQSITQPTGENIEAVISDSGVILRGKMEVIHEEL